MNAGTTLGALVTAMWVGGGAFIVWPGRRR